MNLSTILIAILIDLAVDVLCLGAAIYIYYKFYIDDQDFDDSDLENI